MASIAQDPTAIDVAPDSQSEIHQKLKKAKAAGAAVRARISVTMGLAGGALVVVLVAAIADAADPLNYAAFYCIGVPGPVLLLLAVLPTDRLVIYGVAAVCCVVSLVCAAFIAAEAKRDARKDRAKWTAVQYVWVVGFLGVAAVMSSAAQLPPRAALRRMWMSLGAVYLASALIWGYVCVTCVNGMKPGSPEHQFFWLTTAELFVLGAVSSWPSFRQRIHAALLARDGQISSAASVAALLGRNDIDHVKAEAQRKFYGVELSQVRLEDIQQSTPDPSLFAKARHARFDEIDWFISHSWHDSPEAKYSALQAARSTFVAANKREPVCWIDKFCIDQTSIADSLMCLPVFLAGCKQLYLFCGPTFLERLWCLLEIFVYLEMGGRVDDVTLVLAPPEGTDDVDAYFEERFARFDVAHATCFDPVERDRLLATIEAGFGGLDQFNASLKGVVADLLKRAADAPRGLERSFSVRASTSNL